MNVAQLGPLPPPLGGVAVHVERLGRRLEEAGHRVEYLRAPDREPTLAYARELLVSSRGADILHSHLVSPLPVMLCGALSRVGFRATVLTIHGRSFLGLLRRGEGRHARRCIWALRQIGALIAASEPIAVDLEALGVTRDRIFVAPAFLAPSREVFAAQSPHPEAAAHLARFAPVVCANAYRLQLFDGVPLYGQDMMVEMMAALRDSHPTLGLVVHTAAATGEDSERQRALERRAESLGVAERIAWVHGSAPFGPTLVRSAAMLRPTNTDGDAISVREALHCGVPVLASDAAQRPEGTVVLPSRDVDAWADALRRVLRSKEQALYPQRDCVPTILDAYERALHR